MIEIKKILCCVDFGEVTPRVIEYAKTICRGEGGRLYLVYVVHSLEFMEQFSVPPSYREEYEKSTRRQAREKMESLIEQYFPGEKGVESVILFGDPAKEIVSFAQKEGVDVVVIGSTSKKGVTELLFGSVGEKVVKMAKGAVLVVKP